MLSNVYDVFRLSEEESKALLGEDLGLPDHEWRLCELDEASQLYFYNEKYCPFRITTDLNNRTFTVSFLSIDDASLRIQWDLSKMNLQNWQARGKLLFRLKQSNWLINLKGIEHYCVTMFGKPTFIDYN